MLAMYLLRVSQTKGPSLILLDKFGLSVDKLKAYSMELNLQL